MGSILKTTILLGALTGLLMVIGGLAGGRHGVQIALIFAVAMNFFSYWFSDKMVLAAYHAKPIDAASAPEVFAIVQELALQAHIPMPRLYLIDSDTPNAFATGRNPNHAAVAVTRGIMRICSRDELKGVLAHELSHVINRDILTSSIAATLIQLAISRTREYQADASGAKLSHNPLLLASALRKLEASNERMPLDAGPATAHLFIVNPLSAQGMTRLFSTHPPIEERIRRL